MTAAPQAAAQTPAARPDGAPWSVPDAARFMGVSKVTIERLVAAGTLKSFKVGTRRLIPDAALRSLASGA